MPWSLYNGLISNEAGQWYLERNKCTGRDLLHTKNNIKPDVIYIWDILKDLTENNTEQDSILAM